ncbi:hypothetical protein A6I77_15790 [Achromobacter xylosoxidans]|nr:hypothetical protein A6I77_15790 [Achromobacter xylosoxidans]
MACGHHGGRVIGGFEYPGALICARVRRSIELGSLMATGRGLPIAFGFFIRFLQSSLNIGCNIDLVFVSGFGGGLNRLARVAVG